MKVGITCPIRFSVFSCGATGAAINIYDYLKEFGYEPILLNTFSNNPSNWYDDCSSLRDKYTVATMEGFEKGSLDLLIDVEGLTPADIRRSLVKTTSSVGKVVVFLRKPVILSDTESIVYPTSRLPRFLEDVDGIFMYTDGLLEEGGANDTFSDYDIQYLRLLVGNDVPIRKVPYLWRPTIINAHYSETNFQPWKVVSQQNPDVKALSWHPHIMETNTTNTSSCIIPMTIMRQIGVRNETGCVLKCSEYTVHNMDQLNNSDFFRDNVKNHMEHNSLKTNYISRQRVVDLVIQPKSMLLSHLRFATYRPILLEAVWVGIPVVHNSLLLRDLGCGLERLYYRDNDIVEAVTAFKTLDSDYMAGIGFFTPENQGELRNRILERFGGITEVHRNAWKAALQSVLNLCPLQDNVGTVAPAGVPSVPSVAPAGVPSVPSVPSVAPAGVPSVTSVAPDKKTFWILFTDMWDDFNPHYNFFLLLLKAASGHRHNIVSESLETLGSVPPDLIIYGPFGDSHLLFPDIPKVHFTGENTLPKWDNNTKLNLGYSLLEREDNSYMRIPLWLLEIDWFNADLEKIVNPKPLPVECVKRANVHEMARHQKRFCAFVVSNPTNPIRNEAYLWLNSYKQVDSAGRLFNNIGDEIFAGRGGGGGELKKHEFLKNYKFSLCFENSYAEGYTTEKLLHAKAAGTIPIYWGDPKVSRDFNEKSFINAQNIRNADDLISLIKDVDQNQAKYEAMYNEPLLDEYRFSLAQRRLAELGQRLWKILDPSVVVPAVLELPSPQVSQGPQVPFNTDALIQNTVFITFATHKFLPSLQIWLQIFNQYKTSMPSLTAHVYLGEDIDDALQTTIATANPAVLFRRLPTFTVPNFDDFWSPEHFAWKLWLLNDANTTLIGKLVIYMDCGVALIRIPIDYIHNVIEHNGLLFLEDPRQKNGQWCSPAFCNAMAVTDEEKERQQIWAGGMVFLAGSTVATRIFSEAFKWAKRRDVITGPKWTDTGGHRHDQSILSILAARDPLCGFYPLDKVHNHHSLRRTFRSGSAMYCHRGNFSQHKDFLPRISEAHVINLKRRSDRLERFYKNHPLFIEDRIIVDEACDGSKLSLTPSLRRLFANNDFKWKKGIVGCAVSHLRLWEALAKEGDDIENYLIMEDDVKFVNGWEVAWAQAVSSIPEDYDVLYLGGILPPNRAGFCSVTERVNKSWGRIAPNRVFGQQEPNRYFHFCNYAYILTKRGAQKILENIRNNNGFYTSADHMICNQIHFLNHYFILPLVAGSYQDDDPKYATADFNNFDRIDGFDSDLWTNKDQFADNGITDNDLSIEKALHDAMSQVIVIPETPETPVTPNEVATSHTIPPLTDPIPTTRKFYTILPYKVSVNDLMEMQWLCDLMDPVSGEFGKKREIHTITEIVPVSVEEAVALVKPIFIIQRPYLDHFNQMVGQRKGPYYALHLSDEAGTDNISWYKDPNCLGVVRNYWRAGVVDTDEKIITIPLGYSRRTSELLGDIIHKTPALPFRELLWSFRGTGWQGRREALKPLDNIVGDKVGGGVASSCVFYDDWKSSDQLGREEYIGELLNSKFVACPGGMNPETFRFYEALEMGCIPLYVRCPGDDLYFQKLVENLQILDIPSWEGMRVVVEYMITNPEIMDKYRRLLLTNWMLWKKRCSERIHKLWS